ncbi:MAG TPA: PAS domain S-box protein [Phycicoccus sp.]|nr:PAS domain S-box protein [Phycicoccus sp.]
MTRPHRPGAPQPPEPGAAETMAWCHEVLDASPDGVVLVDEETITFVNPRLVELSGRPREELVGRPLEDLVPESLRARHEELRHAYRRSPRTRGMGEGLPLRLRRADGSWLPVEVALAPLTVSGRPMTLATVRDVSARQAGDAERARLAQLLDLVPDSVVVVDLGSATIQHVNRAASALLGYPEDELVGMETARLLPTGHEEPDREPGASHPPLLTDGRRLHSVRLQARDGGVVDCEVHATMVDGPSGEPLLVNVVRDIGERLSLERRLRESEESLRTAFEQAPVGIAITRMAPSGAGTVVRANEALTTMLGYPAHGLEGTDPGDLRPVEDADGPEAMHRQVFTGELHGRTVTRRYLRPDGSSVWADVRATPMDVQADGDVLYLVHLVDVTRRFDAEVSARKQAQVTQCVADVASAALERRPEAVVIERIAVGAREVLEADTAAVLLSEGEGPRRRWGASVGALAEPLRAALEAGGDEVVAALAPPTAVAFDAPPPGSPESLTRAVGPMVLAPFGRVGSPPSGVVVACRAPGAVPFSDEDVERLARLATQTQVALHLGRARADQQRLALLEERQRIARELHDTVIQDVIGVGMQISSEIDAEVDTRRQERDLEWVARLEEATRNLRRAVFELRGSTRRASTHSDVTDLLAEASRMLAHFPSVTFSGPVDRLPPTVADDLVAVLREALANVARHAGATRTAVTVEVADGILTLTVEDDGVGVAGRPRIGYGLGYIEQRARRHGGDLTLGPGPAAGTRLVWTCPVHEEDAGH